MKAPVQRLDIGKLIPVETVFLYAEEEEIVLETDTGQIGKGGSVQEAAEDLLENAPGYLYLDTADYLLVEPGMEGIVAEMKPYLRASTGVCSADRGTDLSVAAEYLTVRRPESKVGEADEKGMQTEGCGDENVS